MDRAVPSQIASGPRHLVDWPWTMVEIECSLCRKHGRHRLTHLSLDDDGAARREANENSDRHPRIRSFYRTRKKAKEGERRQRAIFCSPSLPPSPRKEPTSGNEAELPCQAISPKKPEMGDDGRENQFCVLPPVNLLTDVDFRQWKSFAITNYQGCANEAPSSVSRSELLCRSSHLVGEKRFSEVTKPLDRARAADFQLKKRHLKNRMQSKVHLPEILSPSKRKDS